MDQPPNQNHVKGPVFVALGGVLVRLPATAVVRDYEHCYELDAWHVAELEDARALEHLTADDVLRTRALKSRAVAVIKAGDGTQYIWTIHISLKLGSLACGEGLLLPVSYERASSAYAIWRTHPQLSASRLINEMAPSPPLLETVLKTSGAELVRSTGELDRSTWTFLCHAVVTKTAALSTSTICEYIAAPQKKRAPNPTKIWPCEAVHENGGKFYVSKRYTIAKTRFEFDLLPFDVSELIWNRLCDEILGCREAKSCVRYWGTLRLVSHQSKAIVEKRTYQFVSRVERNLLDLTLGKAQVVAGLLAPRRQLANDWLGDIEKHGTVALPDDYALPSPRRLCAALQRWIRVKKPRRGRESTSGDTWKRHARRRRVYYDDESAEDEIDVLPQPPAVASFSRISLRLWVPLTPAQAIVHRNRMIDKLNNRICELTANTVRVKLVFNDQPPPSPPPPPPPPPITRAKTRAQTRLLAMQNS